MQTPVQTPTIEVVRTAGKIRRVFPGMLLAVGLGYLANWLAEFSPYLDALVVGLVLGMIFRMCFGNREACNAGFTLTGTLLIQLGLILYGVNLNFTRLIHMGWEVPLLIVALQGAVIAVSLLAARKLRMDEKTGLLLGVGTAICGASAIAVTAPAIEGESKDVSIALVVITLIGTIGTLLFTVLAPHLGLNAQLFGFLCASTLHQTGMVKVASTAIPGAWEAALSVKLFRTAMLAPIVIGLGYRQSRLNARDFGQRTSFPIPWFVLAFVGVALLASFGVFSSAQIKSVSHIGKILFTVALAAIGAQVNVTAFVNAGMKSVYAGVLCWVVALAMAALGLLFFLV
ncbi:MAG: YeiH family protein [Candidatus Tectimicrobiota bacterium]